MMDRQTAIEKAKKCLALSKSANEHEAAAAIRQAGKIMASFGITEAEIAASEISETLRELTAKSKPPRWVMSLVSAAANHFGVKPMLRQGGGYAFRFVGIAPLDEVAAYCYDALLRQATQARKAYMKSLPPMPSAQKRQRGDAFAYAWACSVSNLLGSAYPVPEQKIKLFLSTKAITLAKGRKPRPVRGYASDFDAGHAAAKDARLHQAVNAAQAVKEIGK